MGNLNCGSRAELENIYSRNKYSILALAKQQSAIQCIEERFPAYQKTFDKSVQGHLGRAVQNIIIEKNEAQKTLDQLRVKVEQEGGHNVFRIKTGRTFQQFLDYEADMKKFDTFKEHASSQFANRSQLIRKSVAGRKDLFLLKQFKQGKMECREFEQLQQQSQDWILQAAVQDHRTQINRNNNQVFQEFKSKVAIEMYESNLLHLDAQGQARECKVGLVERWQKMLGSVL